MGSDKGCQAKYDAVSSPILTEATIFIERRPTETLISSPSLHIPPLPTLPFDLIPEILCSLPVKLLMQFRCVCKSWNSLITDSKFAKNHLRFSTTRLVHSIIKSSDPLHNYVIKSYPLESVFSDLATDVIAQLEYPPNDHYVSYVGSCNGMICLVKYYQGFPTFQLWNPSIRKFKELPPLEKPQNLCHVLGLYGFGYDADNKNYKVVVVSHLRDSSGNFFEKDSDGSYFGHQCLGKHSEVPFLLWSASKRNICEWHD